jgi:hypothetical protein
MAALSSRQLLLLALCAAAAFSAPQAADAFYTSSSGVVSLTGDNFDSKIKSGGVWMVEVGVVTDRLSWPEIVVCRLPRPASSADLCN